MTDNPDDSPIRVFAVTPDSKPMLLRLALLAYVGKACTICGHVLSDVADLETRGMVRSNAPPAPVELACKTCWEGQQR